MHTYVAIKDLQEVMDAVGIVSNWKSLGINLGVSLDLIDWTEEHKYSVKDRLVEVLRNWLQMKSVDNKEKPTWNQLVDALKPINRDVSEKISKKDYLNEVFL